MNKGFSPLVDREQTDLINEFRSTQQDDNNTSPGYSADNSSQLPPPDFSTSQVQAIQDQSPHYQSPANQPVSSKPLRDSVRSAIDNYFAHLDGQMVTDLYELFLSEVEAPLLESVLEYTGNNQSKTAALLGLNRGTLRKKLKKYGHL